MDMNNKVVAIVVILLIVLTLGAVIFISGNRDKQRVQENSLSQQENFEIGENIQVIVTEISFEPSNIEVNVNDVVTWVNNSGQVATVNSDSHPTHTLNKLLNLGQFDVGSTVQVFFTEPGTYPYHNHLNPVQKGVIIVK